MTFADGTPRDSFAVFNRAAHARARQLTAERRQADIEEGRTPYGGGGVDHDAVIETEQLDEAARELKEVLGVVGDVPSIIEAEQQVGEALAGMADLEGFETRLTEGVRHVERAQELVIAYGEHVAKLHREGLLKIGNQAFDDLVLMLVGVGDACGRWLDYAGKELDDIS